MYRTSVGHTKCQSGLARLYGPSLQSDAEAERHQVKCSTCAQTGARHKCCSSVLARLMPWSYSHVASGMPYATSVSCVADDIITRESLQRCHQYGNTARRLDLNCQSSKLWQMHCHVTRCATEITRETLQRRCHQGSVACRLGLDCQSSMLWHMHCHITRCITRPY